MVMRKVSSKSEPPMLSTVRILRRLLRKAFLVTNRVRVILVNSRRGQVRMERHTSLISIDEKLGPRQPAAAKNRKPSPLKLNTTFLRHRKLRVGGKKRSIRRCHPKAVPAYLFRTSISRKRCTASLGPKSSSSNHW